MNFICDEQEKIQSSKIKLIRDIEGEVYANIDRALISRLFVNLITNAYRYNKKIGSVTVTLKKTDESIVFSVKDTGIGISEEDLPKIWERFYQVDKARSYSENGGSGLGLAMVKWIANALGGEVYPVNYVSIEDAKAYCDWLTEKDRVNTYRLPNESEWELAAGHMPKDADFNCGINDGRTPVDEYAEVIRGAHGAIDFWGNVWEWTVAVRNDNNSTTVYGIKGGSWKSDRTDCRTEYREEGRNGSVGYDDVGFRVIKVLNGVEPE